MLPINSAPTPLNAGFLDDLLIKKEANEEKDPFFDTIFLPSKEIAPLSNKKITLETGAFQWGKMLFENGAFYKGGFQNDQPNGHGKLVQPDGSKYVGQMMDGKQHGFGIEYYKNGEKRYQGNWHEGEWHDHGTLYAEGAIYIHKGIFKHGKKHGDGKEFFQGKLSRHGIWQNNELKKEF